MDKQKASLGGHGKDEARLEEITQTLASLRSVLKSRSSILRRVAESRLYSILALALGSAIGLFGIFAHFASNDAGSNPSRIGGWALAFFAIFLFLGGSAKIHFSRKLTKSIDPDGFAALLKAIYWGKATSILASAAISIAVGIAFLASENLYGYIVPLVSIFIGFAAHALDLLIDLVEYKVLGWSCLILGLASLPFAEAYPWLSCAVCMGVGFAAFGISGLWRAAKREPANHA